MTGHATVARGLAIDVPVIMLASSRSLISPRWNDDMRSVDVVLGAPSSSARW